VLDKFSVEECATCLQWLSCPAEERWLVATHVVRTVTEMEMPIGGITRL
jgi:hypothetical protein